MLPISWDSLAPFCTLPSDPGNHVLVASWPSCNSLLTVHYFFNMLMGASACEALNSVRLRRTLTCMTRFPGEGSAIPNKVRHHLPSPTLCCKNKKRMAGWNQHGTDVCGVPSNELQSNTSWRLQWSPQVWLWLYVLLSILQLLICAMAIMAFITISLE